MKEILKPILITPKLECLEVDLDGLPVLTLYLHLAKLETPRLGIVIFMF